MNIKEITHLNSFGVGVELTTVKIHGENVFDCTGRQIINAWDEKHKCWRTSKGMGIPSDGRGFYAMRSRKTPHFYYSANPVHIKERQKRAEAELAKRKLVEIADAKNLELFREDLEELLKRYGASIDAEQLSGDDQGAEVGLSISVGNSCLSI